MLLNAKRIVTGTLCLALTGPGLPAMAQPIGLPSMGAASSDELTPDAERQLGEAIMSQGRLDPTYIDDAELNQYLTRVGRKLAAYAPNPVPPIEMFGVLDPEINAFTLPGGFIGVNTGLILACESESELAGVLGHEIGHVAQRHIARGMTQSGQNGMIALASVAAALIAGLAARSGDLAMGIATFGQAAAISRQLEFSRDAEREADRAGLRMLYKAGYDPKGMASLFGRLMMDSRLNDGTGGGPWARTHPQSIERMTDMQNRIRDLPTVHYTNTADFWFLRAKVRVLQGGDSQALRDIRETLRSEVVSDAGVRRAAALYGLSRYWLRRDDLTQAAAYWNQAKAAWPDGAPELARLGIDIALARKDVPDALAQAQAAVKRWPGRQALAMSYATALQSAGRTTAAQAYLRAKAKEWGKDQPDLYQMLARSEDRSGSKVAARRDMAQYYLLTGAYAAAAYQLQQARSLSTDFYEQSELDAQLNDVRQRLQDERDLLRRFKGVIPKG
ncbi:M48 family metalloprotease [Bordetella sp. FB-8]|uniref:M48 family metalloprotease n=1 Tax=Bordetella sp. FB-8 TaxID=1159870 RepID=UPI00036B39C0|nr:M48 family metalloprotease [Bordetella sp. FB-8]